MGVRGWVLSVATFGFGGMASAGEYRGFGSRGGGVVGVDATAYLLLARGDSKSG